MKTVPTVTIDYDKKWRPDVGRLPLHGPEGLSIAGAHVLSPNLSTSGFPFARVERKKNSSAVEDSASTLYAVR